MKYKIVGDNLPAVICSLEAGEALMSQAGAMSWMSEGIQMETVGGGVGKVFGRMFSGESLFLNRYQALRNAWAQGADVTSLDPHIGKENLKAPPKSGRRRKI